MNKRRWLYLWSQITRWWAEHLPRRVQVWVLVLAAGNAAKYHPTADPNELNLWDILDALEKNQVGTCPSAVMTRASTTLVSEHVGRACVRCGVRVRPLSEVLGGEIYLHWK